MTEYALVSLLRVWVIVPISGAFILICAFFWNLRRDDRKVFLCELSNQGECINSINKSISEIDISIARIDERIKNLENKL